MTVARLVAEAAGSLSPEQRKLAFARGGVAEALAIPAVRRALREAEATGISAAPDAVLLALRATLLAGSSGAEPDDSAELVVTIPGRFDLPARATGPVVGEMLREAKHELVILGYEISNQEVVRGVHDAARRGVEVWLCCDHGRGSAQRLAAEWPRGTPLSRVFCARVRTDEGPHASMHGKVLLVDGRDALITSANFTHHGLNANVEVGVRLRGIRAAELRICVKEMLSAGLFDEIAAEGNA